MKGSTALALFLLLLLGGFFLAFSGSVDDAHITYWSAWALASKGEILNYNLERIEQSSALLQVLILALLYKLTAMSVVTLGHGVTMLAASLAVVVAARMAAGIRADMIEPASLLLATSPFFVYWAYGGMEGPLLALLLLLTVWVWQAFLEGRRGIAIVGVLTLATQLTRPEMLLVSPLAATLLLLLRSAGSTPEHWRLQSLLLLWAGQCATAGLILLWRQTYFHDWWPQPVAAKAGGGLLANTLRGLEYAWGAVSQPGLVLTSVLALLALLYIVSNVLRATLPPRLLLAGIWSVTYTAFVIASGGDWMAAGRFWVPVVPLYALMSAYLLVVLLPELVWRRACLVLLLAGHVFGLWQGTGTDFNGVPLWKQDKLQPADDAHRYSFFERHGREHLHDIPTLAFARPLVQRILEERGSAQPVHIMVGQAGMVVYYLSQEFNGRLRVVDRNGLIDRTFTGCPAALALPRTRNGLGNGYEWVVKHRKELAACGFALPDIVFDIDTAWNRRNTEALRQIGYVFLYEQRGHIVHEDGLLPIRRIGAGQYIAVSPAVAGLLGSPEPVHRFF